jgi:hypothetical protein
MAVIETAFNIGDVVFHGATTTQTFTHPCPDCLGTRKWLAKSPAGGEFEVECPRCTGGYQSSRALNLKYVQHTPHVNRLTVGLVRACAGPDQEHEYMCLETGIGSGSLYRESRLFATEEAALAAATASAALANADTAGWVAKQYDETAKFSDYQLKDAEIAAAQARSSRVLYDVQYLIEDLTEATSLDAVRERLGEWNERREAA